MSDYTPGPWTVSDAFNVPVNDRDHPEKCPSVWLDRLQGGTGLRLGFGSADKRERILADAQLIATSPELLEASERLLEMIDLPKDQWETGFDDLAFTGRVNILRRAITKATTPDQETT
jgi:hypothetical protein